MRKATPFALLAVAALATACDDEVLPAYDESELAYFEEIAFGTEFGAPWDTIALRKFTADVRIRIEGFPSQRQVGTVHQVARELDGLVSGIRVRALLRGDDGAANLTVHFVTHDSMVAAVGEWAEEQAAVFQIFRDGSFTIDSSRAWISYDVGSEDFLDHVIREELTQALGLGQDSWSYPESIFFQGPSTVTAFAPIDRSVIRMLYDRRVEPGMLRDEVRDILGGG